MIETSKWTCDPKQTAVIVFAYPNNMITMEAMAWLWKRFPIENVFGVNVPHVIRARNSAIKTYVTGSKAQPRMRLGAHITDIVMMDNDIRPSDASDAFLCLDCDLAACRYDTGSQLSWASVDAFHLGLCKIRRDVFARVAAPWFNFDMASDGCELTACECQHFARKAAVAGCTIGNAGWAEHKPSNSWAHAG